MNFCCSKSRQPLVSTRSSGIMTWGTISAALLLSTVCILWSFSLYCCMTANPVTAELQHLHSALNMLIKMNMAILNTEMEQNTTPGFATAKLLSFLLPPYGLKVSSKIWMQSLHELCSHDLCRPCCCFESSPASVSSVFLNHLVDRNT